MDNVGNPSDIIAHPTTTSVGTTTEVLHHPIFVNNRLEQTHRDYIHHDIINKQKLLRSFYCPLFVKFVFSAFY